MLQRMLAGLVALGVFVGGLLAAEAVVVKLEKRNLTVKFGDKEKTYKLEKGTHIHDTDGKEVKGKAIREKLKPGVKLDIEEEGGKIKEINIKK